jgi:hypothetical protein
MKTLNLHTLQYQQPTIIIVDRIGASWFNSVEGKDTML